MRFARMASTSLIPAWIDSYAAFCRSVSSVVYTLKLERANVESPTATNVMFNVGHVLSPEMVKALAQRFHDLNPKPLGGAPQAHVAEGAKIFKTEIVIYERL